MSDLDLEQGFDVNVLRDNEPVAAKWREEDVVLVRHGGRVCALSGTCSHLGAPLEKGIVVAGEIRCPFHHARFSLETGEAVAAPAFEPLDLFKVVEEGGRVRVVGKRPREKIPAQASSSSLGKVVIIGGGAAGHACAEMLARHGAGNSVLVLSDDNDPPYDRTACSKAYLAGESARDEVMLPMAAGGNGVAPGIRVATEIVRVHPERSEIETSTGERVAYDTLVLAAGATPTFPGFEGSDRDDVHVVRTLADADALRDAAEAAKSAVVLGSSYIGLEVAAALIQRGLSVSVVAEGKIPLEKTVGPEMGAVLRKLHEEKGVRFHMGRQIERWDGASATLDDGSRITGDLLVVGAGVEPRLDLARDAGLAIADEAQGGGVAVDRFLRTSVDGIYAIGDIASVPDPRLSHTIRVEHWVVAQRMGQWLARHLLGLVDEPYADLPFFWSGHYDFNLRYVGHVGSPDERTIEGDLNRKDVAIFFGENGETQALLTCGRDLQSLEVEAEWERK